MEQTIENDNVSVTNGNVQSLMNKRDNVTKSNRCNQCDYASSYASHLRTHLKTHSGEKSNKCNQCDYVYFRASDLNKHLRKVEKSQTNATNATMPTFWQVI